jgi:GST-like protein
VAVSQSGAIVLYAAEKSGKFLPSDLEQRAEVLRWFMHACTDCAVTSGAIFALGNSAPEKSPANVEFFENRLVRFLRVIDGVLGDRNSIAADVSIADFALYPVYVARKAVVERAGNFANLTRWATAIGARPAVQRGLAACG